MCASQTNTSLGRWENEGGAPKARRHPRPRRSAPALPTVSALYYFNVRSGSALMDDPEGLTLPNGKTAIEEALALARDSLAEGDREGEDRRGWQVEIMDRANQRLMTVTFTEACVCEWPRRREGA
jgi:hypothetical protein